MPRSRPATLAAAGLALALAATGTASAAGAGSGAPRMPLLATLYEHDHYRGEAMPIRGFSCTPDGDTPVEVDRMPDGWNDRVSSIDVEVRCDLFSYEHENQTGRSLRLRWDMPTLGGFNDRISSLRILPN
ncbi:hypothetical protein ABT354_12515 [Streptomyces sp. NPDC000594]|uniref:hypothetical protein n=1 Tax=Streptomyces sp. NPDC000594 TaxID=3154261 RepID=UPI0033241569